MSSLSVRMESMEMETMPTESATAPRARRWQGIMLRALVSVAALGWLIWETDWQNIQATLVGVRWNYCFAAFVLYCGAQAISSFRWQILAQAMGFEGSLGRYVSLYYVGMFFNLFLPTSMGGDVVRAWFLAGRPGRRMAALLSVFSERFSGLLALLVVAGAATFFSLESYPLWVSATIWGMLAGAVGGLLMLPMLSQWHSNFQKVSQALSIHRGHWRRFAGTMGLSFVVQIAGVAQVWLIGLAMNLPVPFYVYAVVAPVVTLLTMLPISVNGLGVREGSLVLLMAPAGVGQAAALALGLLWFSMLGTASLLGGGVYLMGGFRGRGTHASPILQREAEVPRLQTSEAIYGLVGDHSDQGRKGQFAAVA